MDGRVPTGAANFEAIHALVVKIYTTVQEMVGAKELCFKLVSDFGDLNKQLQDMRAHEYLQAVTVLEPFGKLLEDVSAFLDKHAHRGKLKRIANHWKMKEVIKGYYEALATIRLQLELQSLKQSADNFKRIEDKQDATMHTMIDHMDDIEKRARADLTTEMSEVKLGIRQMSSLLTAEIAKDGPAVLADIKTEVKNNSAQYTDEDLETMKDVLVLAGTVKGVTVPDVEIWYVPRGEIKYYDKFDAGAKKSLFHGELYSGTKVTVSVANAEADNTKLSKAFIKEVRKWYVLSDPHVLPLYGANHTANPYLIICGRATNGNFNQYLKTHRNHFWRVFLDAARGLAYLHKHKLVHGNLKCNNLLVSEHGVGMVSDFAFAFVRADSFISAKPQVTTFHWKAPECFAAGVKGPRFESDVFSLGMCMFEALAGEPAFNHLKDKPTDAIGKIVAGELPESPLVPQHVMTLIRKMCALNFQDRIKLSNLITTLAKFADEEARAQEVCGACGQQVDSVSSDPAAGVIQRMDSINLGQEATSHPSTRQDFM